MKRAGIIQQGPKIKQRWFVKQQLCMHAEDDDWMLRCGLQEHLQNVEFIDASSIQQAPWFPQYDAGDARKTREVHDLADANKMCRLLEILAKPHACCCRVFTKVPCHQSYGAHTPRVAPPSMQALIASWSHTFVVSRFAVWTCR